MGEKWQANHAMWQSVGEEWKVWVKSKPTWRKSRLKCGWKVKSVGKTNPGADKSHLSIGGRQICQTCVSPKILSMTKIYPRNMKGKFPHWVFHSYFYHWKATRLLQCQTNNVNFKTLDLVLIAWILNSKFLLWGMSDLSRMHFLKKVSMLLKSCEEKPKVNISIGGSQICQTFQTFAHGTLSPTFINTTKNTADISKGPPRPPKDQQLPIWSKAPPAL